MKEIKLSRLQFQELVSAFEDNNLEHSYFLDAESGEVVFMSDYIDIDDELSLSIEEAFGDKYIRVPRIESSEAFDEMVEFVQSITNVKTKNIVLNSLQGNKGVFRRFKDTLNRFPDERNRWFDFKEERNMKKILEQLEYEGIKIVLNDDKAFEG
ncbi:UPF0158 family protein [Paenibacillus sp. FSL K6-0276]|uniref:UPF0158 family protein n=1 Tax=unclassified Paenibacillus TaxID=185978 RepID=UPI0028B25809|nr:UPF0158 family protein [Paenibacillus sp.]